MKSIVMLFGLLTTSSLFAKPIMATNKEIYDELLRRDQKNVVEVYEATCVAEQLYSYKLLINKLNLKSGQQYGTNYGIASDCFTIAKNLNSLFTLGDDQTHSIEFSSDGAKYIFKVTNGDLKGVK